MRRLGGSALVLAAALGMARAAQGVQIVFEAVEAPSSQVGVSCPAPCFNVQMFFEDPTRSVEIQALQFDIEIADGGVAAELPVPPQTSSQAAGANLELLRPWDLSATVGKSPNAGFDALLVNAATRPFSVNSVQAEFDALCGGGSCPLAEAALALNRIYLGRFNATLTSDDPSFRIGGITGLGAAIVELKDFHTPGWDEVAPPPPAPAPVPDEIEPAGPPSDPAELPESTPYDGPVIIDVPWCRACTLQCGGERCAYILNGGPYVRTTDSIPGEAAPEPRTAFLVWLGASLLALRRARRSAR